MEPVLSICIPTRHRPSLLRRALASVVQTPAEYGPSVELIVSDNSDDDSSEGIVKEALAGWAGASRYVRNPAGLGMVGNFNRCVGLASGQYVLILHDDDHLMPGAVPALLAVVADAGPRARVLLPGVHVVDNRGRVLRRQEFRRTQYLPPALALRRVLAHSSFVRFPAIVVHRDAYRAVGPFNADVGGATDFDMWVRLFAECGVLCLPVTTAAYVVHPEAHTVSVWTVATVENALAIFARAEVLGILSPATLRRCKVAWFHQFILSGAVRRLRLRDRSGARRVLGLFEYPAVRELGWSLRWLPVRIALRLATLRHHGADLARV